MKHDESIMPFKFIVATILLSTAGWAAGITDPQCAMDEGALSVPLFTSFSFQPNSSGGGQTGFYNPTSGYITAVGFQVQLALEIQFGVGSVPH